MAYKVRKVRNQDCYKTYNTETKRVFAKCTTKEKALRQLATIRRTIYGTSKSPPKTAKTLKGGVYRHSIMSHRSQNNNI